MSKKLSEASRDFIKYYYMAFIIFALCTLDQFFVRALRYDRNLIASEPWRLLSAHFVHLGWSHFWMNMGALALIWLMFARRIATWQWLFILIASSLLISLGVHIFNPEYRYYVGLSGSLHALLSAGIYREWRHDKIYALAVGAALAAKLCYEAIYGAMPGSEATAGGKVLVEAHLYGAIAGIFSIALSDFGYRLSGRAKRKTA